MKIRLVKKEDLNDLKEIWKLSFGDPDSFIDLYFQTRDWLRETAVLLDGGKAVSMMTMIPVDLIDESGEKCSASMIYAVATHPGFQKRGFSARLIGFCNDYLLSNGTAATLLVPASEDLFRFYEKQGYLNSFYVKEAEINRGEIEKLQDKSSALCRITPAEPAEYNRIRRKFLNGQAYLDYRDDEILFQKRLALMFDADLFAVEIGGIEGCAYAERMSQEEVIIKEFLVPDRFLAAALKELTRLLTADRYIVRTPPGFGEILGGEVRPFGMLRLNGSGCRQTDTASYLGIAYD
jgi:GNAT superfamily N-acetyltransferase